MELTEQQKQVSNSQEFWEMQEKAKKYQESLPPYSTEQVIEEMKARNQYKETGEIF